MVNKGEGKLVRVGSFSSEKAAALAYDDEVKRRDGDEALTNFNDDGQPNVRHGSGGSPLPPPPLSSSYSSG